MKVTIFQRAYDLIKGIKTPKWWKEIGDEVDAAVSIAIKAIGQETYELLKAKIIEVSNKNIDNKAKFNEVFDFAKVIGFKLSDSILNVIINATVLAFKNKGIIK